MYSSDSKVIPKLISIHNRFITLKLDFLDNHKSDLFSPKEIANGLGKKTTREVNNVTRLLRKLLAACDVLQPKEIKGKYGCIPF